MQNIVIAKPYRFVPPQRGKFWWRLFGPIQTLARRMAQGRTMVSASWSLQQAASMRKATYTPMDVNWMPGGRQPIAVHHATGRIYVLMHMGEYWSEYEPAEEIWEFDGNSHKLVRRHPLGDLKGKFINIAVSQDRDGMGDIKDDQRLVNVHFQIPARPAKPYRYVVGHYLNRDHRQRFALGRIDFSGHD